MRQWAFSHSKTTPKVANYDLCRLACCASEIESSWSSSFPSPQSVFPTWILMKANEIAQLELLDQFFPEAGLPLPANISTGTSFSSE